MCEQICEQIGQRWLSDKQNRSATALGQVTAPRPRFSEGEAALPNFHEELRLWTHLGA